MGLSTYWDEPPAFFRPEVIRVSLWLVLTLWLLRLIARLLVWIIRTPSAMVTITLGIAFALGWRLTPALPLGTMAAFVAGLVVWQLRWPVTFEAQVRLRARSWWRAGFVYRRQWATAMDTAGLLVERRRTDYIPPLLAMQRDLVGRNVVELTEVPAGRAGRVSKAFTAEMADAVLVQTGADRFHAYIVVSMLTGARTEELRALRWEHVRLEADPAFMEVWRSVRAGGDTKTRRSRRTIALPARCVAALRLEADRQARDSQSPGGLAGDGLVLTSLVGRRWMRRCSSLLSACARWGGWCGAGEWTPRELRHSFVSLLSDAGMPIKEIAGVVGHSGTTVTEFVYRHQLRPMIRTGPR